MKNFYASIFSIIILSALVYLGVEVLHFDFLFAVLVPYAAIAIFIAGTVYKLISWSRSPVPFNITTTVGQQKSLPQIKHNLIGAPTTSLGVIGRMAMEVLFFRSLLADTNIEKNEGNLRYKPQPFLWIAAMAFHWSMLIIVLRHFRYFVEPPLFAGFINSFDGFIRAGETGLFLTDIIIVFALTYLLFRRLAISRIKYISLASDYFALALILAISASGIIMTFSHSADVATVKLYALGLFSFSPSHYSSLGFAFDSHLIFVCALLIYFPFSKLLHMPGVFFSPTLNSTSDTRAARHINPWNPPVKGRSYENWEDEFRPMLQNADISVEKE